MTARDQATPAEVYALGMRIARDRAMVEWLWTEVLGRRLDAWAERRIASGEFHPLTDIADAMGCVKDWRKATPGRGSSIQHYGFRAECTVTLVCPDGGTTAHTSIHECRAIVEALCKATEFEFQEVEPC